MNQLISSYILLTILFTVQSFSCEIDVPKSLIVAKGIESFELKAAFKYVQCSDKEIKRFNLLLTDYSGTLNQRILYSELNNPRMKLSKSFDIIKLESLINLKTQLPKDWKVIDLKIIGSTPNYFSLKDTQHLQVICNNCNTTGSKNIRIKISNTTTKTNTTYWLSGNIAIKVAALASKKNISITNRPLKREDFKLVNIYSSRPENYFSANDKLPYFKANRPIHSGQAIEYRDISPINLINIGTPTKVTLHSNGLQLQTTAMPSRSGKIGDIIQLKNIKTNKIIIGKVTNFNEVEVKL